MEKQSFNFKKSLGQNFIFDTNLLNAIATDGEVQKQDTVLEIGAGAGSLTKVLCERAKNVISFEIDLNLKPVLDEVKAQCKNLTLYYQDFMEFDLNAIKMENARVVANIPYYITTPIIFKLIESKQNFKSILVLIQKEVAERFSAKPKTKDYGITSVILQTLFDVSITRVVKKECFTPSPKVDSALVKLVPHKKYVINNFDKFKQFVHTAFSMRRKTLVNNLKNVYDKQAVETALNELNYALNVRPEEIDVKNFVKLYNLVK